MADKRLRLSDRAQAVIREDAIELGSVFVVVCPGDGPYSITIPDEKSAAPRFCIFCGTRLKSALELTASEPKIGTRR